MLGGYPPFYSDIDDDDLFRLIKAGNFEFHKPFWDPISEGPFICPPVRPSVATLKSNSQSLGQSYAGAWNRAIES